MSVSNHSNNTVILGQSPHYIYFLFNACKYTVTPTERDQVISYIIPYNLSVKDVKCGRLMNFQYRLFGIRHNFFI